MKSLNNSLQLACASLAVVVGPALAQQPERSQAGALEEIVVTAQKRTESLQTTPVAVSAITAASIEQRGITDISTLTAVAPNIAVTTAPASSSNTAIFIRGIGDQEPVLTSDAPVSIYVDGIVLGRSTGAVFDLVDLERIEVLRGPQGTLYGRNTIGGAVNFITAKPAQEFGIKQRFTYGSWDQWQSRTTLDTGLLGDTGLRAKFSYVHREQDGYVNDPTAPSNRDPGALNIDAVRAAVAFDQGGAFRADYAFDFNHRESIAPAYQATVIRPDVLAFLNNSPSLGGAAPVVSRSRLKRIALDGDGLLTDKVWGHTLTLEADLGENTTLRSLTGYRKWRNVDRGDDLDGQAGILGQTVDPIILAGGPFIPTGVQPISLFYSDNRRRQHQWSQEFNLLGSLGDRLEYVLGLFYFKEKSREENPQFPTIVLTPDFATTAQALLSFRHRSRSQAAFGQLTYELTDQLSVTGGLRYTSDKKSLDQIAPFPRDLSRKFDRFNWTVSADYRLTQDVLAYARVATGYKAGGFNARSSNSGYSPEDLTSYELGLKSEFLDRRVRLNAALFYAKHEDLQIQQFQAGSQGSTSVTVNAGQADYKGIELEGQALLMDGLTLSGALGYIDRKYKQFLILDPATNQIIDVADTARFPLSSSLTWNAALQYELPRFDFGQLSARVEYNYRGKVYFHPTLVGTPLNDEIAGEARGLLDARLTLSELSLLGEGASIAVWAKNLTDKAYRIHGIDFGALGYAGNVYGEPRSFGVDLNFSF
ncbi:MAG TPA: TonB-dependent receptor [Pedomonas sp.]|uniref:TonB-dependent receptor n=1 Tax=Pedomonas sp. TaxID=2976421 RepID=UPI002F40408A